MSYKENRIGSAVAGDTGMPGSGYEAIWVGVAHHADDEFEARAKYGRGSNQGHLEEHEGLRTSGRGDSVEAALEIVTADVLEWDCDISIPERRAAIRECKYEALDWLKENSTDAPRVAFSLGEASLIQDALVTSLESDLGDAEKESALKALVAKIRDAGWRYTFELEKGATS
jgi:hypothetical protein